MRLQKFLAEAGIASRRAAELMIREGRVTLNGRSEIPPGTQVDPARDRVMVDGRPVKAKKKLYLALNKPPGYICSRNDPEGRRTIYELLPREWDNLYSIGRLDFNSEGLVFLTNDGEFCLRLSHPRYGTQKTYIVSVEGKVDGPSLQPLTRGILHEGEKLKADSVKILSSTKRVTVLEIILSEGKNREVRRLCQSLGLVVIRLQRVKIGKIGLRELPSGRWRTLTEVEIKSLLKAV